MWRFDVLVRDVVSSGCPSPTLSRRFAPPSQPLPPSSLESPLFRFPIPDSRIPNPYFPTP
ncbi:MAG: hypothetical protein HC933_17885 [Pleurocapsa sp. SU_196_0]|nr:hypothetical protein [Pleurocapsa sp. SU_196_0]